MLFTGNGGGCGVRLPGRAMSSSSRLLRSRTRTGCITSSSPRPSGPSRISPSGFAQAAPSINTMGRPHLRLSGEEIAREVHEAGGLIGPAHAFTPWTSLYASFDLARDCYGGERPDLLELGLSADSSYGAGISELRGIPFLTNSDAHSPSPAKIGREFNRMQVRALTVKAVLEALQEGGIAMNAGFFPEEGKYNRTACTRCYRQFTLAEAKDLLWRCPDDGGLLKKGVSDRAKELSDGPAEPRPPYLHLIPLAEIIQRVLGTSSPTTKRCTAVYTSSSRHSGKRSGSSWTSPLPS